MADGNVLRYEHEKNYDFNDKCSDDDEFFNEDEFYDDGLHEMTREESKVYGKQVRESDGFDVDVIPGVFEFGIIQPYDIKKVENIKASREVTQFAIDNFNKTCQGGLLQLDRVIKWNLQAAAPLNYYITFTATDTTTGVTEMYQAQVFGRCPWKDSTVEIFRKKPDQQINQVDESRFLTIFAIIHYNRTQGENLELIEVKSCNQQDKNYSITFKARNLSTCYVEVYKTEVVSGVPMQNSKVKVFKKEPSSFDIKDLKKTARDVRSSTSGSKHDLKKTERGVRSSTSGSKRDLKKEHGVRSSTSGSKCGKAQNKKYMLPE